MNSRHSIVWLLFLLILSLCTAADADTEFSLPTDTVIIQAGAFENTSLADADVRLPEGLTTIESRAFAGTGLKEVYIPQSVTYIAPDAFAGCTDFHPTVDAGSYAASWCSANSITPRVFTGLGVAARSREAILSFIQEHPADRTSSETFRREPTGGVYGGDVYQSGLLSETSLTNAINMVNQIRYIAGLNADVVNAPEWEEALAAAAMINGLNNGLSHYPTRPAVLQDSQYDSLYQLARDGASRSNLHAGNMNLAESVLSYMDDSDSSNIAMVGHRRWILNPSMGKTTFGLYVQKRTYTFSDGSVYEFPFPFSGMYSFDRSGSGSQKPIAWPAQQTPLDYFGGNSCAWSVSFGSSLNANAIHVTVRDLQTKQVWKFSSAAADGYFNVNNDGYGIPGCVIFRPDGISVNAGDRYEVTIRNDNSYSVLRYTVTFFDL